MSFEVGDRVWDVRFGEGVVIRVVPGRDYPVNVQLEAHMCIKLYRHDGKYAMEDIYPSLYHHGTKLIPAPEPVRCPFKKYDRVLVRDACNDVWMVALFKYFEPAVEYKYGVFLCPSDDLDEEATYQYCIPFEGMQHLIGTTQEPNS